MPLNATNVLMDNSSNMESAAPVLQTAQNVPKMDAKNAKEIISHL